MRSVTIQIDITEKSQLTLIKPKNIYYYRLDKNI